MSKYFDWVGQTEDNMRFCPVCKKTQEIIRIAKGTLEFTHCKKCTHMYGCKDINEEDRKK